MHDAGSALVSEIRHHWRVTDATARKILRSAKLTPTGSRWERYYWSDLWALEGAPYVPRRDWAAYRAPLLTVAELSALDPNHRAARTLRRHVQQGRIPCIQLSPDIRRVRRTVFEQAIHHV